MLKLHFDNPVKFDPDIQSIPDGWQDYSFDDLNFSRKEKLRDFIVDYFKEFKRDSADSLYLFPNDFAFKLLVAIYREITKRVSADYYRFLNWSSYTAMLKSLWQRSEKQLMDDLYGVKFLFIFNLMFSSKESIEYFNKIMSYCYIHKVRIFIASRHMNVNLVESMPEDIKIIFNSKLLSVSIK